MTTRPSAHRSQRDTSKRMEPNFDHKLAAKCDRIIGARVTSMQYPGGKSRDSVRFLLPGRPPVYVSTRSSKHRADIERTVLKTISGANGNVPKLLGSDGKKMLVQEEIPGVRLSQAIHKTSDDTVLRYLDRALDSLAKIQKAGSEHYLDVRLPRLGDSPNWLFGLLDRPAVLGRFFGIPAPKPRLELLETLLASRKPRFVKWDSRPGNAIVRADGEVYWIDWEHSGVRNRLDDMVWLLADEFVPYLPDIEAKLLDKYLPVFADDLAVDNARQYFYAFGVFHLTVRMGLIFKYKKNQSWWSYEKCLGGDKAGVTLQNVLRICKRGENWAAKSSVTLVLSQWFRHIAAKLQ